MGERVASERRGAAVTATKKFIPGKRIKTWHRKSQSGQSLRAFARFLAQEQNGDENAKRTARDWMRGKGMRP